MSRIDKYVSFRGQIGTKLLFGCLIVGACGGNPDARAKEYLASGEKYLEAKKYPEAIIELKNATNTDPNLAKARLQLARAHAQVSDFKNAYLEYRRVADLMIDDLEVQAEVGNILLLGRFFDEAKERARRILVKDPQNLQGLVLLGNALAGLRDFESAVSVAERAIELAPEREGGYTNLGVFELARGNHQEAEQAFRQAIERNPRSPTAHLALANFLQSVNRLDESEQSFKRALEIEPTHYRANRGLAALYVNTSVPARAEPYLRRMAELVNDADSWLELADYLVQEGRPEEALKALDNVPGDPASLRRANGRRAEIAHTRGRTAEAHEIVRKLLNQHPNDGDALALSARFFLSERRVEEALKQATAGLQADPNSAAAHFMVGKVHLVRSELETARRAFLEALKLDPSRIDAKLELTRLHLQRKEIETAIEIATNAIRDHAHNLEARVMLVRALLARPETYGQAASEIERLSKQYPSSPVVRNSVGAYYLAMNNIPAARVEFQRALDMDPNYLDPLMQLVTLDMRAGKHNDARRRLRDRLRARPDNPTLLLASAKVVLVQQQMGEAERILRRLVEVDQANFEGYTLLGQLYISAKQYTAAAAAFSEIIKRDPNSAAAHTMLGLLMHALRRPTEAIAHYEKAFSSDHRSTTAANNLAWVLAENDTDLERALQLAQAAKAVSPSDPQVLDTLGWVYVKRGMHTLAVTNLLEAVQFDSRNAMYFYHLGVAQAKSGDDAKARKALNRALELQPDFPRADDARSILKTLVY